MRASGQGRASRNHDVFARLPRRALERSATPCTSSEPAPAHEARAPPRVAPRIAGEEVNAAPRARQRTDTTSESSEKRAREVLSREASSATRTSRCENRFLLVRGGSGAGQEERKSGRAKSHRARKRPLDGRALQRRTMTIVPLPGSTFVPCHPAGTLGSENRNKRIASIGERLMQPWLRGRPNRSCQYAAWSA